MALTKLTTDVAVIAALPDAPTDTAAELKGKFDFAGTTIKTFINNTLIDELDTAIATIPVGLAASRALASDADGAVAVTAVTATELGYVSGVTSAIQAQLDAKQKTVTSGTDAPSGGADGDIYIQYA
jgi:hypothetical protein